MTNVDHEVLVPNAGTGRRLRDAPGRGRDSPALARRHALEPAEHGGFVVHLFDLALVDRLSVGFGAPEVVSFQEERVAPAVWCVTRQRAPAPQL